MRTFYAIILFAFTGAIANGQCAWTQKANLGGASRLGAVGFSIGTKGYIGAGSNYTGAFLYNDFWEWDPITNVWTQKADCGGTGLFFATGFSIGDKGYIGTGSYTNGLWEWDPTTNVWTEKATFCAVGRSKAIGFSIGTKGYIGTGVDNHNVNFQDFWEWDQATNLWTQKATFGGMSRVRATGFSIGNKGYIGTGIQNTGWCHDFWEWDQATNLWTQKADLGGTGRYSPIGFSIGTKGYIGTGTDSLSNFNKEIWEWDQASNTWAQKGNFGGRARRGAVGFSIGSMGYLGVGDTCVGGVWCVTNDFWEYNPALDFTIAISKTNLTCNAAGNGTAIIVVSGSTPPYTYLWSNGKTTSAVTGLYAGTYTVKTTAANGCTTVNAVTITQPAVLTASLIANPSSCTATNGSATANVSGGTAPYSYSWNPSGQTTKTATGLAAGTYTVNITDANSCTKTNTLAIQSPVFTTSISVTNVSLCNASDGKATANVLGGSGSYIYSWNPGGQTTQTATGLPVGMYTVIVTDVNSNCMDTASQLVSVIEWKQKANFGGTGRSSAVGFSIGTKGYIGTGNNGGLSGSNYTDLWEWNQATNVWTQKASMGGVARRGAVGFSIGAKGYIGTGTDGLATEYADFWEWDQATNAWTQKANVGGLPRYNAVSFSIGTKGYVGTGIDASDNETKDFWEWDQATNVWTQKADFGGAVRYAAVGFSIGTKGYIGTGAGAIFTGPNYQDFWEWDQATNVWTQKANFGGTARSGATGFSIGAKGYIGTGYVSQTYFNDFWEWDQATNSWTQKTNVGGAGRDAAVGFSIGTTGYIGMGYDNGDTYRKDFWEYTPCLTNPLSVNETVKENLISVYPNPSSGKFIVKPEISKGEIAIYNVAGEKVYEQAIRQQQLMNSGNNSSARPTGPSFSIDLSSQPAGVYFLQVKDDDKWYMQKIVIQK